jgi:hypothetical protein
MTKTTNFEISKKLSEIGFNEETNFYYRKNDKELFINTPPDLKDSEKFFLKSYDLEILLDALPSEIEIENWGGWKYYNIYFKMNKNGFWYENLCNCDSSACPVEKYHYMEIIENESLADTAGRLIILLHEKNLIKF